MKNVLMGCIALFLMCCQPEEKKDKAIAIETDSVRLPLAYAIIRPDSSQLKYQFTDYLKPINLSEQDLKQIENIIAEARFQPMDWRKETVQINDGGSCFWNILINLNTGKNELNINGV